MHIRHDIDFAGLLFRASLQCAYYMILSAFPMSRHGVFRAVSTHFCPQMIIPFSLFYPGCSGNCVIVGKLSPLRLKLFPTYSVRLRQKRQKTAARLTVQPPISTGMPTTCNQYGPSSHSKHRLQMLVFIEDMGYNSGKGV